MQFENIKNIDVPDLSEIIKSGKKTKIDLDKLKDNKVDVQFYYSDLKFKSSTEGFLSHIAGIPIVYIDYPEKLGFFVLDNSLIYDISKQCFTIIVCENYIHSVSLKEFNNDNELNLTKNTLKLLENITFKSPLIPDMFEFEKCFLNDGDINDNNNSIKKQIELIPSHLSALGRSKLLERTTAKTNDALIIMLALGFLIGVIVGIIITLLVI